MWCAECGCEYRVGFTHCSDCQIELVATKPESLSEPADVVENGDHEVAMYDLAVLPAERRDFVELLLSGSEIGHERQLGQRLVVARSATGQVDEVLAFANADAVDELEAPNRPSVDLEESVPRLAGLVRRLIGAYIDGVIVGFAAAPLSTVVLSGWLIVQLVYEIVPVALWGKTAGKVIVGCRVESVDQRSRPGWYTATVRATIPLLGFLLVEVASVVFDGSIGLPAAVVTSVTWNIAVFAPILGANRRGLHDRWAGTRVVVEKS